MKIILTILLILICIGCVSETFISNLENYSKEHKSDKEIAMYQEGRCDSYLSEKDRWDCTIAAAMHDISICDKYSTTQAKSCRREVMIKRGNITFCQEENSQDRIDWCIKDIASYHLDPKLCERIITEDKLDSCYYSIGTELKDISLCNKINDKTLKERCELSSVQDFEDCKDLADQDLIDECYSGFAEENYNPGLCKLITSPNAKDICILEFSRYLCFRKLSNDDMQCYQTLWEDDYCSLISDETMKSECYLSLAIRLNDSTICTFAGELMNKCLISNGLKVTQEFCNEQQEDTKEDCFEILAYDENNPDYCTLTGNSEHRCYSNLASKNQNPDICELDDFKDICLRNLAIETDDASVCSRINDSGMRDGCFILLPGKSKTYCSEMSDDLSRDWCIVATMKTMDDCDEIEDLPTQDLCRINMGIKKSDISICDELNNASNRDDCLWMMSDQLNDTEICSLIENQYTKEYCLYNQIGSTATLCNYFEGGEKDLCFFRFVISSSEKESCYFASGDLKDRCLILVGFIQKNESVCDEIVDQSLAEKCINSIKNQAVDTIVCTKIDGIAWKLKCMTEISAVEIIQFRNQ